VPLDNSYAERVDTLFYSKSDEKFTVRALLDEVFGNKKFGNSLDIGPGAGHISEPLYRRSKHLTLVEKLPKFEPILRTQFEDAEVIIKSINDVTLPPKFDAILFSHVLYYQPEQEWMNLTQRLFDSLVKDGELIVALNSDAGDWWQIVHTFWDKLREHISFHYIPLTQFRKELSKLGHLHIYPYRYQMWIEPADWNYFVGKQLLEIEDDAVLRANEAAIAALANNFKTVDGNIVLDFKAELIRIQKDGM